MVGQWQQAVALGVAPTLVPSLQPEPEAASLCFFIQLLFLFYTRHSHAPREADSWCSRKAAAPHLDWVDASCLAHISALGNKIAVFSFLLSHASSTANSHGMVGSIMSRLAAVELHHDVVCEGLCWWCRLGTGASDQDPLTCCTPGYGSALQPDEMWCRLAFGLGQRGQHSSWPCHRCVQRARECIVCHSNQKLNLASICLEFATGRPFWSLCKQCFAILTSSPCVLVQQPWSYSAHYPYS